ncbi:MAG: hypothetical protein A4E57_00689 [Syntrophorhabdaceae bacterium PtaU1.Bin034]|jgi:hypothetical protein|nr:MAG: hypothetical protein A4E57_00689 [Syntrophorhabdaceae bacterium PtaU1.Bin034]
MLGEEMGETLDEIEKNLDDLLRQRIVTQMEIVTRKEQLRTIEAKIVRLLIRTSRVPRYVNCWAGCADRYGNEQDGLKIIRE